MVLDWCLEEDDMWLLLLVCGILNFFLSFRLDLEHKDPFYFIGYSISGVLFGSAIRLYLDF